MAYGGILSEKETIRDIRADETRMSRRYVPREIRETEIEEGFVHSNQEIEEKAA